VSVEENALPFFLPKSVFPKEKKERIETGEVEEEEIKRNNNR
jgi:hypothetical protein